MVFVYDTFDQVLGHTFAIDDVRITIDGIPGQSDSDADGVGDLCDGRIELRFDDEADLVWDPEQNFETWNVYRGDLSVLVAEGLYTQAPGSNPLASRQCGVPTRAFTDSEPIPSGAVAFYLVTPSGVDDLGADGDGTPRPNTEPCP